MTTLRELAERVTKVERELAYMSGRMSEMNRSVSLLPNGNKITIIKTISVLAGVIVALAGAIVVLVKLTS